MRSWSESVGKHCEWFAQDRTVMHLRFGPFLSSSFTVLSWKRWQTSIFEQYPAPAIFIIRVVPTKPWLRLCASLVCFALQVAVRLLPRVVPGPVKQSVLETWFASARVLVDPVPPAVDRVRRGARPIQRGLGVGGAGHFSSFSRTPRPHAFSKLNFCGGTGGVHFPQDSQHSLTRWPRSRCTRSRVVQVFHAAAGAALLLGRAAATGGALRLAQAVRWMGLPLN